MPSTLFQPNICARVGANRAANTVLELPIPAMPRALPSCSGGYQRETSGRATAQDAAAKPSTSPTPKTGRESGREVVWKYEDTFVVSVSVKKTNRKPKIQVHN